MLRAWDYKLYGVKAPPRTVLIAAILNINILCTSVQKVSRSVKALLASPVRLTE